MIHRQPPARGSGISEKGAVQNAKDSCAGGREGKETPEEKEKGGKKVGHPFFPSLMAKEKTHGVDRPKSPHDEKYPVVYHIPATPPWNSSYQNHGKRPIDGRIAL
jgi:hypothetical protein